MSSVKTCSRCKKEKNIDEFRNENRQCNQCCEVKKKYRENNPEKVKEYQKQYSQKSYICPLCNFEVKTGRKSRHEKSVGHQYYLQQFKKNEEPEKPDVIYIDDDGVRKCVCFGCRTTETENSWGSHMFGNHGIKHFENKKKYEERKKENPNSIEMRANRFWMSKSII